MKTQISVWPDDTEGRHNRAWIVSLDSVDVVGGDAINSQTVHHYSNYDEADRAARQLRAERLLPVVVSDEHGRRTVYQ